MFDPQRLLGQVLGGMMGGGERRRGRDRDRGGGLLGGLGNFGGLGGSAKLGAGIGLLGVAMAAFEHFKGGQGAGAAAPPPPPAPLPASGGPPPPPPPPPMAAPAAAAPVAAPPDPAAAAAALHLLRSMIAAAHADGVLDASERTAISQRAREAGLPAEDLMALGAELAAPRTIEQLVAETPAHLRRETYAAALLAITVDTEAERDWLDRLAAALPIRDADRQQIHQQLGGAPAA